MNRDRRKEIDGAIAAIERIQMELEMQAQIVADIRADEESYRDAIPENMQGSERYEAADAAVDALTSAQDDLEAIDFDSILESLREARR
ncbi:hypothetical protein [Sphingobium sp. LF-16]|uniref:hypothetical protein n=1 Tax=Sphingobium sp. LF-16 TaxID=2185111 RepID=UPI000F089A81|nr:hypothetical protein [Sphingobium sp. LF-16]